MSWSYDPALSTDKDKVRLFIGDTDTTAQLFSDEEISALLVSVPSPSLAAALLADAQAAKYSRFSAISIDGASFAYQQRADMFRTLANRLRAQATATEAGGIGTPAVSGVSISEDNGVAADPDREPSRITVGGFDYPGTMIQGPDAPLGTGSSQ